ncbi:hypothetical protein [Streptomyces sp. NPDC057403]|uniref:hypothetical protein n=1 Tax=Streptomyces sp. NPDC057403 TaxID=3346119 RepID=UPI003688A868
MSAKVLIIAQLDGYANSVKPLAVERFLREHGHDVHLVDTAYLARASGRPGSLGRMLPGSPHPARLALYANDVASKVLTRRWGPARRHLSYYVMMADHLLRRSILSKELRLDDYDLVICETPYDSGVLRTPTSARTLYDCPNPWADEVFCEGRLTRRQHSRFRRWETRFLEDMQHLSFSWETYGRYAVAQYGISGANFTQLNWGCTPATQRARFARPPRVAYIGSLSGQFIDLPLLARLTRRYPHIDVYGGPPPDPSLGLRYRGYASPEVLQEYQFGLITCSRDLIRREGFSAKHLHYLAHGLPVLVPAWRRNLELLRGSVTYKEDNFRSVIDSLSREAAWRAMSDEAYVQGERLDWRRTLQPLQALLQDAQRTAVGTESLSSPHR